MKSALKANLKSTAANQDKALFSVIVTAEINGYTAGTKLTEPRLIADYFRQHAESDAVNEATDAQVVAVIKATDVKGMNDEDANEARLTAILAAPFATADTSDIPTQTELAMSGSNAGIARKYGEQVDAQTTGGITKAIEGEKDKNAGPVITAANLERQFDSVTIGNQSFFDCVPAIGTRYQKSKSDRAPFGYRLPNDNGEANKKLPVFHGPYDHSLVENRSGVGPAEIRTHWVAEFVLAKMGADVYAKIEHCRALLKDAAKDDCPKELSDLKGNKVALQAKLDEYAFEFNRTVRIVSQAFKLIERKRAISDRFSSSGITVELVGVEEFNETPVTAARRNKPFTIASMRKSASGKDVQVFSPPLAMSRILNLEPLKFPANSKVSELIAVKRGTKQPTGTQSASMVAEIQTTDKLEEYLSAVSNYADKAENLSAIRKRIASAENGGKLASDLVGTFDLIAPLVTDDVRKLARGYDDNAARAMALAVKADNGNGEKKVA